MRQIVAAAIGVALCCGACNSKTRENCTDLAEAYRAAFAEARVCTLGDDTTCSAYAMSDLTGTCQVGVNPARKDVLEDLATRYAAEGCPSVPFGPCPAPAVYVCNADADGNVCVPGM